MYVNKCYRHKVTGQCIYVYFKRPSSYYGFYYVYENDKGKVSGINKDDFIMDQWEEISKELYNEVKESNVCKEESNEL